MKRKSGVQYTVRQIPPVLDQALRRKFREEGKSMNQTAIDVLHDGLAVKGHAVRHRDLDFMIGSWVENPSFDEAIRAQDRVDPKLWK